MPGDPPGRDSGSTPGRGSGSGPGHDGGAGADRGGSTGAGRFAGVGLIGAAEVPYRRRPEGVDTPGLLAAAFTAALRDAGVAHGEVDGLAVSSFTLSPDHAIDLGWKLGLTLRWCMDDALGGASGINMIQHAARAIQAGDANVVAVVSGDHFGPGDFAGLVDNYNRTTRDHLAPLRFGGPNAPFAMLTQRHMRAHGLERADYGALCMAQRRWAAGNPGAVYRAPLTLEEYLSDRIVADPLCRFDCVPVVSGADAVVLARGEDGIRIRALRCRYNPDHGEGDGLSTGLAGLAREFWAEAGVGPEAVDLASIYDDYPVMVLAQLADLGFAPDGDVRRLLHERIATGALPVNTSGGQLSAGQAGAAAGLHGVVEAVQQLRNRAGARQVPGARLALAAGYGMVQYRYGMCANAALLEAPAA
ncbi:thiolase family protein [Roseomonas sp. BN140053]|uniref:thiolase family protein n=1 Tax=Roseomonas sp. BN140053 TaxID=3391898 RepID=UPI0039EAA9B1